MNCHMRKWLQRAWHTECNEDQLCSIYIYRLLTSFQPVHQGIDNNVNTDINKSTFKQWDILFDDGSLKHYSLENYRLVLTFYKIRIWQLMFESPYLYKKYVDNQLDFFML